MFESGGYHQNIGGLTQAKISARGPYNNASMALTTGSSYAFVLYMSDSVSLAINARVESVSITTDVSKPVEVNISAQSTGTLTSAIA